VEGLSKEMPGVKISFDVPARTISEVKILAERRGDPLAGTASDQPSGE
jgi:hypothetical protein